jgi:hypothetical protein
MNEYFFATARTALWYGLQQLPIERGKRMFVPDYVCEVVLHPLEELGIRTVAYHVNDQFVPDWEVIEKLQLSEPADAFLLVHYFGQPQDIEHARDFCEQHGMWLIEDNAHGHGGTLNGQPLGSFGDLGFSSPRKQLQSASGGALYLHGNPVELKIEVLPDYHISKSKELLRNMFRPFPRIKAGLHRMLGSKPDFSDPSAFPEKRMGHFSADINSVSSILQENWSDHAATRRENWCDWSRYAKENGLRPIWSKPHPESCPWMLPVYAANPEARIDWLHKSWLNGDDLFPWPTLPETVLQSSSSAISRWKHLLCFPLHRKLKNS